MPLERRKRLVELAAHPVRCSIESDIYSELRYEGEAHADVETTGRARENTSSGQLFEDLVSGTARGLGDRSS